MLLPDVTAQRKSSRFKQESRFRSCKMKQLTRTAICISEVCALAPMASILPLEQKTSRSGYTIHFIEACNWGYTTANVNLSQVWDIASRTISRTFSGHEQDIYSLDFARNGRHIASGSGDRTVRLWDLETGKEALNLPIEDGVTTVAISADGQYVAAGSLDKSVRVWDARNGYMVDRLDGPDGHKDSVYSVAFAPNGRELVSGSLDKTIKMWELSDGRNMMGQSRGGKCIRTFEGHKVSIRYW